MIDNTNQVASPLLVLDNVHVQFEVKGPKLLSKKQKVQAVSGVSLTINPGETFGLVGESGCGKTTLANLIMGMVDISEGSIVFKNQNIHKIEKKAFINLRRSMQMIFQDPYSSLNPRFTAMHIITEPMVIRGGHSKQELEERAIELLELVGLNREDLNRYPSAFSGGQKQRLGIARAIALNPELLVCDEPVSALDVSVHAQILNLLADLQKELGLTYLFISHNLAVVRKVCTNIAVMYLGKVVEYGSTEAIFKNPLHPYTKALMSAVLDLDVSNWENRIKLKGETPSPINPPLGCRFSARCYQKGPYCADKPTILTEVEENHFVACHKFDQ